MILTDAELEALTKRKHRDAQRAALVALGVEHKVRPDGSLIVSAAHIERLLGGLPKGKVRAPAEPNWDALAPTPQ